MRTNWIYCSWMEVQGKQKIKTPSHTTAVYNNSCDARWLLLWVRSFFGECIRRLDGAKTRRYIIPLISSVSAFASNYYWFACVVNCMVAFMLKINAYKRLYITFCAVRMTLLFAGVFLKKMRTLQQWNCSIGHPLRIILLMGGICVTIHQCAARINFKCCAWENP